MDDNSTAETKSATPPTPANGVSNQRNGSSAASAAAQSATTGPSRKQNVACDACRARKVKCNPVPGSDKCQHCITKNLDCTHLIQQATSEKRRAVGNRRSKISPPDFTGQLPSNYALNAAARSVVSSPSEIGPLFPHNPLAELPYGASRQHTNQTLQLIDWLFSPPDDTVPIPPFVGGVDAAGYRSFLIRSKIPVQRHADADWGDLKRHLQPDDLRTEYALANDLVEVYFQICHSRMPLFSPTEFRNRLQAYLRPTSALDPNILPLPPALLATVIAWGAKFSEHPLLVHDREMNAGRSRICRILTRRAREVAEGEKIHRLPSIDNLINALLLEPLQSHNPSDPDAGFRGFWLNCAVRHLFELQVNRRDRLSLLPDEARAKLIYAWWMACIADAFAAVYWRRKPVIEDDDYDITFLEDRAITPLDPTLHSPENAWIAQLAMAQIARALARQLSKPGVSSQGIPFDVIKHAMASLTSWKEDWLHIVGVPNNFQADWDFVAAVSACTCDAQYHVMWVILHSAVEEFGLREVKAGAVSMDLYRDLDRQIFDEALLGALRIAGLTSVLTSNGYLRLDPNILHFSTYAAGMFLARHGKTEAKTCIKGLEQYSFAYEEAFEQAKWMQQVYSSSVHSLMSSSSSSIGSSIGDMDAPLPIFMAGANGSSTIINISQVSACP
ncbi:hypothetical protein CPB86DRAFT_701823 [Serendipita vermifera]|nr:hypothetical protein CPB86DRAFT_701823 [Serendipita vermifera]